MTIFSKTCGYTFNVHVRVAVAEAVRQQVAAGIDIISDGEQGKPGFHLYALARLSSCEMIVQPGIFMPQDVADHPDLPAKLFGSGAAQRFPLILCNGAITMRDPDAVHRDIANFKAALDGVQVEEAFMTAVSPGSVAALVRNNFYPSREAYLYALASAMAHEYRAMTPRRNMLDICGKSQREQKKVVSLRETHL